ncbi:MAG: UPF0182 family protein [Nitrososphaerales archaeon]
MKLIVVAVVALFLVFAIGGQLVFFYLNLVEFGDVYIRPIYFEVIGGLVLSTIALFRIDLLHRRSLTWWIMRLVIRLIREKGLIDQIPLDYLDFKTFKMGVTGFIAWQFTKLFVGVLFFGNLLFGMALLGMSNGWEANLGSLWSIFKLPFLQIGLDPSLTQTTVIPMIPAIMLIVTPLLGAFAIRLILLFGITELVRVVTPTPEEITGERMNIGWRFPIIETIIAVALYWAMFNTFFISFIDFNTKWAIIGLGIGGTFFLIFALLDRKKLAFARLAQKRFTLQFAAIVIIALLIGSVMVVQNSIADARKIEYLGPYTTQEIAVNRFFAELDDVEVLPYQFRTTPILPSEITNEVATNQELLEKVRLWDWDAAFAKLKPEIGLIPFVDFRDSDILRFNGTLFWSASMKPILPSSVRADDAWFNEHLVYTHVPNGFLLLNGQEGVIVDSAEHFDQRRIYYGEGGLLEETWMAYPTDRVRSDELGGFEYDGEGGLTVPPPISWFFDSNFFFAFRDTDVQLLRFRDIHDRMTLLFPFLANFLEGTRGRGDIDMIPVRDDNGNTYWLYPLIVELDGNRVPWSSGNKLMRLVGYSIVDIFTGEMRILLLGDDFFTSLFEKTYDDVEELTIIRETPDWLQNQLKYPEQLFFWRVQMFNFYHVEDAEIFINARQFFEVPLDLETFYIFAEPPGFEKPTYLGLLSLELVGSEGRNLAGYMTIGNEFDQFGDLKFYAVPLESDTKLLGPSAVVEALEKDSQFRQLRTLLREPRLGDNILYRVGTHDVYFIPIYTAGAGGVVAELAAVAAVGALFTGEINIGLSVSPTLSAEQAFRSYLATTTGLDAPPIEIVTETEEQKSKLDQVFDLFAARNVTVINVDAVNPNLTFLEGNLTFNSQDDFSVVEETIFQFIEEHVKGEKVLMWVQDQEFFFGAVTNVDGVVELHYIAITFGQN